MSGAKWSTAEVSEYSIDGFLCLDGGNDPELSAAIRSFGDIYLINSA